MDPLGPGAWGGVREMSYADTQLSEFLLEFSNSDSNTRSDSDLFFLLASDLFIVKIRLLPTKPDNINENKNKVDIPILVPVL